MSDHPVREETGGGADVLVQHHDCEGCQVEVVSQPGRDVVVRRRGGGTPVVLVRLGHAANESPPWLSAAITRGVEHALGASASSSKDEGGGVTRALHVAVDALQTIYAEGGPDDDLRGDQAEHAAVMRGQADEALNRVYDLTGWLLDDRPAPSVSQQGSTNVASPEAIREHQRRSANSSEEQWPVSQQGTGERLISVDLIDRIDRALSKAITTAVALAEDTPYRDDPRWSPWTRFWQPVAKRCSDARDDLRAIRAASVPFSQQKCSLSSSAWSPGGGTDA